MGTQGGHGTLTGGPQAKDLLTIINHIRPADGWNTTNEIQTKKFIAELEDTGVKESLQGGNKP